MQLDRTLFRELAALRLANPGLATGLRQGDRRSPFLGRGVEFADYREYHPGDDLRMVDWNVYARLEQVLVRLFHEDRNLSVRVFVDATASMDFGEPRKLDHAGALAAGIALIGLLRRDTMALSVLGGTGPQNIVRGHNQSAFPGMVKLLEASEPGPPIDLAHALRSRIQGGKSNRVILISDMMIEDDAREDLLRILAATKGSPVLLHTLCEEELEPDLSDPSRIVDTETGEELHIRGGASAADAYQEALDEWVEEIRARCTSLRIQYVPAHTTVSAKHLLTQTMLRGRIVESAVGGVA